MSTCNISHLHICPCFLHFHLIHAINGQAGPTSNIFRYTFARANVMPSNLSNMEFESKNSPTILLSAKFTKYFSRPWNLLTISPSKVLLPWHFHTVSQSLLLTVASANLLSSTAQAALFVVPVIVTAALLSAYCFIVGNNPGLRVLLSLSVTVSMSSTRRSWPSVLL